MAIISDYQEEKQEEQKQQKKPSEESSSSASAVQKVETEENQAAADKKEEDKKENDKSNVLAPNKGNGLDFEKYSWTQNLQEATVNVPVPHGTKGRDVVCEIKKNSLKIGLKGQPPIVDGELFQSVKVEDSVWTIEDQKFISVLLVKQKQMDWWKCLIKGEPEVDTQKVEPETSKLSDLDAETRTTVEKMMFDQRQKAMGRPSSDEMQQSEILKKFMAEHPEIDFSNVKMPSGGKMPFGGNMPKKF